MAASVVLHEVNNIADTVAEAKFMKVLVGFPGRGAVADGGRRAYPPAVGDSMGLVTWQQMSF